MSLLYAFGAIGVVSVIYAFNRKLGLTLFLIAVMGMALTYYNQGKRIKL